MLCGMLDGTRKVRMSSDVDKRCRRYIPEPEYDLHDMLLIRDILSRSLKSFLTIITNTDDDNARLESNRQASESHLMFTLPGLQHRSPVLIFLQQQALVPKKCI